jgi:hypothetical protein
MEEKKGRVKDPPLHCANFAESISELRAPALLQLFDQLRHDFEVIADHAEVSGQNRSRLLSDDLAVLPNVNRSSVHARRLARDFGRPAQRSTDGNGKFRRRLSLIGLRRLLLLFSFVHVEEILEQLKQRCK